MTGTAGLDEVWVPLSLVVFGVGSFVGVTVAGRLSDRHRRPGDRCGGTVGTGDVGPVWVAAAMSGIALLMLPPSLRLLAPRSRRREVVG